MAVANATPSLGEVMLREGHVTQGQLRAALGEQKSSAHSLGRVLVDLGFITEETRTAVLKKSFGLQTIDLKGLRVDPLLSMLIPAAFAHKHRILPVRQEGEGILVVAMEDPSDLMVLDAVKSQVGMRIKPFIANSKDLAEAIQRQYHGEQAEGGKKPGPSLRSNKALRQVFKSLFLFLYVAPIIVGVVAILLFQEAQDFVNATRPFDFGLYAVLFSALWAIVIFEISGLLFGRDEKQGEGSE